DDQADDQHDDPEPDEELRGLHGHAEDEQQDTDDEDEQPRWHVNSLRVGHPEGWSCCVQADSDPGIAHLERSARIVAFARQGPRRDRENGSLVGPSRWYSASRLRRRLPCLDTY